MGNPVKIPSCKHLNTMVEQDHRRTLRGIEAMEMVRKGRVRWIATDNVVGQAKFITKLFGIAA